MNHSAVTQPWTFRTTGRVQQWLLDGEDLKKRIIAKDGLLRQISVSMASMRWCPPCCLSAIWYCSGMVVHDNMAQTPPGTGENQTKAEVSQHWLLVPASWGLRAADGRRLWRSLGSMGPLTLWTHPVERPSQHWDPQRYLLLL